MPGLFRADHVGSLLRPAEVKDARRAYQDGRMEPYELRSVEDSAILSNYLKKRCGVDGGTR